MWLWWNKKITKCPICNKKGTREGIFDLTMVKTYYSYSCENEKCEYMGIWWDQNNSPVLYVVYKNIKIQWQHNTLSPIDYLDNSFTTIENITRTEFLTNMKKYLKKIELYLTFE